MSRYCTVHQFKIRTGKCGSVSTYCGHRVLALRQSQNVSVFASWRNSDFLRLAHISFVQYKHLSINAETLNCV